MLTDIQERIDPDKKWRNLQSLGKDNAPQNFAVLRHIAVNALGKEKSQKLGIKNKQFCAGWDNEY